MKSEMSIGEKIREFRIRKGYSQEVMADILEMSSTGYAKIEQNKTPNLSLKRLNQIAEALETNIFELLSLGEKNTYYIHSETGGSAGFNYTINQNIPMEYQRVCVENDHLKEKITLLQEKISDLNEIIELSKDKSLLS